MGAEVPKDELDIDNDSDHDSEFGANKTGMVITNRHEQGSVQELIGNIIANKI